MTDQDTPEVLQRCRGPLNDPALCVRNRIGVHRAASASQFDCSAPLLAGTKLPSRKACARSSFRSVSRDAGIARQIVCQTQDSSHSFSRLQQVVGEPYLRVTSCQRAPVRSTPRIPSKVLRSSARGRHMCFDGGRYGAVNAHCSSLSSRRMQNRFLNPQHIRSRLRKLLLVSQPRLCASF